MLKVPDGWREVRLGEVLTLQRGFDLPEERRRPGPFPIVSSSGTFGTHYEARAKGPGVVTGRYGTIGRVFYVREDYWPLNTTLWVRDFKGNDPRFIGFLMESVSFLSYSDKSSVPGVNRNHLHQEKVRLPPLMEQRAIAHVLGSLDDKIELNRRLNQTLEEICRALFRFWFVDFGPVRAKAEGGWKKGESLPGMPADMWDLWPSEFEESAIGDMPKGWAVDGLGEVASCRRDLVDPSEIDPEERYVGLEHITPKSLSLWHWGRVGETVSGKSRFKRGEILFGKLRPYFHKVCVPSFEGVASTDILTVAPKSSDWFGFVLGHFSSTALVDYATATSNGTKMPRTSWDDLARWQVATPPVELARSLSAAFRPLISKMEEAIEEATVLCEARDALLPKFLSGEIRVPVEGDS